MGSAVVTATLTGTTRALGIPNVPAPYQPPSEESIAVGLKLIGTVFGTLATIGVVGRVAKHVLGGDRAEQSCPRICTVRELGARGRPDEISEEERFLRAPRERGGEGRLLENKRRRVNGVCANGPRIELRRK